MNAGKACQLVAPKARQPTAACSLATETGSSSISVIPNRPSMLGRMALITLFAITGAARGGVRDDLASVVVLLSKDTPKTVIVEGQRYEMGLRAPGEVSFKAQMQRLSGTGFLIQKGDMLFLVTAKHLATELDPDSRATVRADLARPHQVSLRELSGWQSDLHWKHHPSADASVTRLKPSVALIAELVGHFLPDTSLAAELPSRDVTLTILGFPLSLGAEASFSPLSRDTHAASGVIRIPPGFDGFLLQDPSVGGYSGAPVFDLGLMIMGQGSISVRSGGPLCVGLISGTVSDDTGGKIATVVPAAVIRQLIDDY